MEALGLKMTLAEIEQDIANVAKALEQTLANHNILVGQRQALEHIVSKIKAAAQDTATVATDVETVINTADAALEPTPVTTS